MVLAFFFAFVLAVAVPLGPSDTAALLRRALEGNARARHELAVRLLPVIRGRLRRGLANWPPGRLGPYDLDDLVHATWCRLLENDSARLRAYDTAAGISVEGYVSMIASQMLSNVIDEQRASKRRAAGGMVELSDALEPSAPTAGPEVEAARLDLAAVWSHLMRSLPARGQAVLKLLYADGCDVPTTATTLGVERQVVYNWQFKIRQLARAFMGEDA